MKSSFAVKHLEKISELLEIFRSILIKNRFACTRCLQDFLYQAVALLDETVERRNKRKFREGGTNCQRDERFARGSFSRGCDARNKVRKGRSPWNWFACRGAHLPRPTSSLLLPFRNVRKTWPINETTSRPGPLSRLNGGSVQFASMTIAIRLISAASFLPLPSPSVLLPVRLLGQLHLR